MSGHLLVRAHTARWGAFDRQGGVCLACHERMDPNAFEAHHRQSRRHLGYCGCNVVALHPRCHTQGSGAVHDSPNAAKELGLIVPSWDDPRTVAVWTTWPWAGSVLLGCDWTLHPNDREEDAKRVDEPPRMP